MPQVGLGLATEPRLALNSWASGLYLPNAVSSSMTVAYPHSRFQILFLFTVFEDLWLTHEWISPRFLTCFVDFLGGGGVHIAQTSLKLAMEMSMALNSDPPVLLFGYWISRNIPLCLALLSARDWTQDLMHVKQAVCHLSYIPHPPFFPSQVRKT